MFYFVAIEHTISYIYYILHIFLRLACILSPMPFNLYAERIMREAKLENDEVGIRIGGRRINNLRYADDTTLLPGSGKICNT